MRACLRVCGECVCVVSVGMCQSMCLLSRPACHVYMCALCFCLACIQVGLLLLPHDGNPHNSKCLLAHPGNVGFGVSVS